MVQLCWLITHDDGCLSMPIVRCYTTPVPSSNSVLSWGFSETAPVWGELDDDSNSDCPNLEPNCMHGALHSCPHPTCLSCHSSLPDWFLMDGMSFASCCSELCWCGVLTEDCSSMSPRAVFPCNLLLVCLFCDRSCARLHG